MSEENKDLGDKAEDAFDAAKDKAKDLGDKAEDAFDSAKEKAGEFADKAEEKANDFADEAKKTANEFSDGLNKAVGGGENKKMLVGILAIILGQFGVHKFLLGYQKEGFIMLGATILGYITACFVIGSFIVMGVAIVGLVEGIIYLTKSDEDFYNTYQIGKKPWF
ncbi:NINE protein [Maribacter sp. MJ134]|uniref:NINE protein n=1 Tax=Maribacter sp. MJ134 TaxID=2496865 RepID=UPI000F84065A|nr:NINE protein [Maribacter sp. MJ134]AZQ59384.1 NINE protein [Maribacter sp. MJ134]